MLAPERPVEFVVCEWRDDFLVVYADCITELVSVKDRDASRGPWSLAALRRSGGLGRLFEVWSQDQSMRARIMTNGALKTGAGEAQAFADACHARDARRLAPWAQRLAKMLDAEVSLVTAFLHALSIEAGLPARAHIGAITIRDLVRPALRARGVDEREAERFYEILLGRSGGGIAAALVTRKTSSR